MTSKDDSALKFTDGRLLSNGYIDVLNLQCSFSEFLIVASIFVFCLINNNKFSYQRFIQNNLYFYLSLGKL